MIVLHWEQSETTGTIKILNLPPPPGPPAQIHLSRKSKRTKNNQLRDINNSSRNDYDSDSNTNGVEDGAEYDRTPSTTSGQPWRSGPPNGAVTIGDALVVVNSIGDHC